MVRFQPVLKMLLFSTERHAPLQTCDLLPLPRFPLLGKVAPPGPMSVSVCPCDPGPCSPLEGSRVCTCMCVSDFVPLPVPALEPEHELFLVYGKGRPGIIRGMDMGAKVPDEHMIPIENLMNPRALDFHAETGFIYFADTTSYLIGRQKIDGTERETILKDGKGPRGGRCMDRTPPQRASPTWDGK